MRDFEPSYCNRCRCVTAHRIDCKDYVVAYTCCVCKRRKDSWTKADDDSKPKQEKPPHKPK